MTKTELRIVAKLLEDESNRELDSVDMAQKIIAALDEERESTARWAAIGQLTILEDDEYEESRGLFVVAPFSTRKKAEAGAYGLNHTGAYFHSSGEWMCAPVVSKASSAWDALAVPKPDKYEKVREYIKENEIRMFGEEWFAEKRGW